MPATETTTHGPVSTPQNGPPGRLTDRPVRLGSGLALAWIVVATALFVSAPMSWLVGWLTLGAVAWNAFFGRRAVRVATAVAREWILRRHLGEARSLMRLLAGGALAAAGYATVYGLVCAQPVYHGRLVWTAPRGEHLPITLDVLPTAGPQDELVIVPAGRTVVVRRLLYFSTTTLLGLNYGDYRPEGRLQWLVMLEGLHGLMLRAAVLVALALRFLPRHHR